VNSTPGPITRQAQPRYRNDPPPKYPDEARRENEQGVVLVRASIDSSGAVTGVQIEKSCGFLQLDKAAVSAVQNWQFDPAESEKKPVPSVVLIPVGFHLSTQND
jgi:protein TonB